jgi:hypothetical protein
MHKVVTKMTISSHDSEPQAHLHVLEDSFKIIERTRQRMDLEAEDKEG